MSSVQSTIIERVPQERAGAVFSALNAQFGLPKTAGMVAETQKHLALGDCSLIVAGETGFVLLNRKPLYRSFARLNVREIQDLAVHPDHRGQGIGVALVKACEEMVREEGGNMIGLGVGLAASYGAAQRLYCKLGYMPDGAGLIYDGEPVPVGDTRPNDHDLCLMMVKEL